MEYTTKLPDSVFAGLLPEAKSEYQLRLSETVTHLTCKKYHGRFCMIDEDELWEAIDYFKYCCKGTDVQKFKVIELSEFAIGYHNIEIYHLQTGKWAGFATFCLHKLLQTFSLVGKKHIESDLAGFGMMFQPDVWYGVESDSFFCQAYKE